MHGGGPRALLARGPRRRPPASGRGRRRRGRAAASRSAASSAAAGPRSARAGTGRGPSTAVEGRGQLAADERGQHPGGPVARARRRPARRRPRPLVVQQEAAGEVLGPEDVVAEEALERGGVADGAALELGHQDGGAVARPRRPAATPAHVRHGGGQLAGLAGPDGEHAALARGRGPAGVDAAASAAERAGVGAEAGQEDVGHRAAGRQADQVEAEGRGTDQRIGHGSASRRLRVGPMLTARRRHATRCHPTAEPVTPWRVQHRRRVRPRVRRHALCCRVRRNRARVARREVLSGADGLVHVQREQQLPVELVGAADQLAGLALERVRRRLEVAGVDVDDVGDRVDQQADRLAVQPDDDDDGVGALGPRRAGRAARAARSR